MKTIVITGATSGIGKAFIQEAGRQLIDCKIIVIARHAPDYALPKNVEVYLADLTDPAAIKKITTSILRTHPQIDVLINNAGNGWRGMIADTTLEEAKVQMEVNVWALVQLTQQFLPAMRRRKQGHIINISSVAASIDYPTIGYYSATKAFVEKISGVLALELAPWNIKVSVLAPGAVRTKFGHNMQNIAAYGKGPHAEGYVLWANRFEKMFKHPLSSDVAARKLVNLIVSPKSYSYLTLRDTWYCYLRRILPRRVFSTLFLKRYMQL